MPQQPKQAGGPTGRASHRPAWGKNIFARWFPLLVLLLVSTGALADTLQGHVVGVHDGDTLTLLTAEKRQVKVRLSEIDAPETAQPYGSRAKQALSDLVFNRDVLVETTTTDRYGRTVGRVYVEGRDVNAALVTAGAAWVYRQYSRDPRLLALEAEAKTASRGLWGLPEAQRTPPWEWRRAQRSGGAPAAQAGRPAAIPPANSTGFSCDGKSTCSQMRSCAEARFHLLQCSQARLDNDHDGVPCESLCR